MQAITTFSFIDYFLYKLNDDKTPLRSSILGSMQLISSTIKGIDFLEFKPSEIAAAVTIYVALETTIVDTEKAMSILTQHVKEERVMKCVEVINDMSLVGGPIKVGSNATVPSVPRSPIGVLDATCFSYKSDDTAVGLFANSYSQTHTSPSCSTKSRKPNRPCEMELKYEELQLWGYFNTYSSCHRNGICIESVPAEVYSSVATAVIWSKRLALSIALYLWIDNMMRPIYAKLIPCDLGAPNKKIRQPLKRCALGSLGQSRMVGNQESRLVPYRFKG